MCPVGDVLPDDEASAEHQQGLEWYCSWIFFFVVFCFFRISLELLEA